MNVYKAESVADKLKSNPYPGRGIVFGITPDGTKRIAAYFIMGRSQNSRNRIFREEADGISTEAFDPSLLEDPSLIIYHPVREFGDKLIVTNGDQTDTIYQYLSRGESFETALRTRTFEPDAPNWTPRISGIQEADGGYKLSILKSLNAEGSACVRQFFEYPPANGLGHFIHTYVTDGTPIPTFTGEPERISTADDMKIFTDMLWDSLNPHNKISLFVRFSDIKDGTYEQSIINIHEQSKAL